MNQMHSEYVVSAPQRSDDRAHGLSTLLRLVHMLVPNPEPHDLLSPEAGETKNIGPGF